MSVVDIDANTGEAAFMTAALAQANEAFDAGEVPVGCVIILDAHGAKRIVGRGRNRTNEALNGTRHAEFEAIDEVMQQQASLLAETGASDVYALFASCDLYVTIEPCIMCASALRHVGIRCVFFGSGNERFGGCGSVLNIHTELSLRSISDRDEHEPPFSVVKGMFAAEAVTLLRRFYLRENEHAPNPKKKATRVLKTEDLKG
ncbi:tRNA(adenine34) deaminase [Entophlyctis luteolus]|nr:tRNA(adenine34) deaminase [Entophlyctis luteolus]